MPAVFAVIVHTSFRKQLSKDSVCYLFSPERCVRAGDSLWMLTLAFVSSSSNAVRIGTALLAIGSTTCTVIKIVLLQNAIDTGTLEISSNKGPQSMKSSASSSSASSDDMISTNNDGKNASSKIKKS